MHLHRARRLTSGVLACIAAMSVAGCSGDSGSGADAAPSPVTAAPLASDADLDETAEEPSASTVLSTPCFDIDDDFELPSGYVATNASGGNEACRFVVRGTDQSDTGVIAGELYQSSRGRSFDGFVQALEENLAVGQEPRISALGDLDTEASGRALSVTGRRDLTEPNRAVVLTHDTDRLDSGQALSAVVAVPTESGATQAILLWGGSGGATEDLMVELIEAMAVRPMTVPE